MLNVKANALYKDLNATPLASHNYITRSINYLLVLIRFLPQATMIIFIIIILLKITTAVETIPGEKE
jgi:hypothetical protein